LRRDLHQVRAGNDQLEAELVPTHEQHPPRNEPFDPGRERVHMERAPLAGDAVEEIPAGGWQSFGLTNLGLRDDRPRHLGRPVDPFRRIDTCPEALREPLELSCRERAQNFLESHGGARSRRPTGRAQVVVLTVLETRHDGIILRNESHT
jgi:hypothetical protein